MAEADYSRRTDQRKAALHRFASATYVATESTPHRRGCHCFSRQCDDNATISHVMLVSPAEVK